MREFRPYGSVRGARRDARPYRDHLCAVAGRRRPPAFLTRDRRYRLTAAQAVPGCLHNADSALLWCSIEGDSWGAWTSLTQRPRAAPPAQAGNTSHLHGNSAQPSKTASLTCSATLHDGQLKTYGQRAAKRPQQMRNREDHVKGETWSYEARALYQHRIRPDRRSLRPGRRNGSSAGQVEDRHG
jgi:hypothetical protein